MIFTFLSVGSLVGLGAFVYCLVRAFLPGPGRKMDWLWAGRGVFWLAPLLLFCVFLHFLSDRSPLNR